jgi:hypothetical protein
VGGPLIANRLFLEQTAQYRYDATEIPSRPQDEVRVDRWLSSFTRLDGNLSPRHSFTATGGLSPSRAEYATLGTFTPPDATVDLRDRIRHMAVNEHATWSDHLLSESMFRVQTPEVRDQSARQPADGAAAGNDARSLLQSANARLSDVSVDS